MDEKLAILGGKPVREKKLFYGHQCIDEEDIQAVDDVLRGDYITCGPYVEQLEKELAKKVKVKYAVAVSNGTAALHCACLAIGLKEGDEVITTPMTFAASANCVRYCGATVVFADINPQTYNIDPNEIEKKITPKTKAVIAVDFTGQAVEHKRIREICDKYHIYFIEDAAHAIGTKYDGKPVGSLADLTCFSFHPVKTVTCGEGGAVTTNDEKLYKKLVLAHTHGITHNDAEMEINEGAWYYEMISLGYNYRLTDFQAALLLSQLKKLDKFKARRQEIVKKYNETFKDIPEIIVQEEIPESDTCRHLYIIQLRLDKLKCSRREFFDAMCAEGIHPQVHYVPVYWFPYYMHLGYTKGLCLKAEKTYKGIMSLPLYPTMTTQDIEDVIAAVKKVINAYKISDEDSMDKVLLLGSTGMLGQALKNTLENDGLEVTGVARENADYNFDLTNDTELRKCVNNFSPDVIINASANVDIDSCEKDSRGGVFRLNSRLPSILANICHKRDLYFIQISTDHYYTGDSDKKHKETDTVKIVNDYARTKYCGEQLALLYDNTLVIRTNIVGFRGRKKHTFIEWAINKIKQKEEMSLYTDFYTSSMHTVDFSSILSEILRKKKLRGIYNIASSTVSNKKDFICELSNKLFGHDPIYHDASVKEISGTKRAESLGLDTTKIEKALGYPMPNLAQTLCSIQDEFERRKAS